MQRYYSFYRPMLVNKNFSDLNPLDCGWADLCPGCSSVMFRNYYIIHYITEGSGTVITPDRKTTVVEKGEMFLIKPNMPTTYTSSKEHPWKYIWISFDGKLSEKFSEINTVKMLFDKNLFYEIKKCESFSSYKEEFLASVIFRLYAELFSTEKHDGFVYAAANYIDYSYNEITSISELADKLCVNRSHLTRTFKQTFGISPQDYLIDKRLEESKKLLLSGMNVAETAQAVGYNDSSVFSRAFKKKYNVSPVNFKN